MRTCGNDVGYCVKCPHSGPVLTLIYGVTAYKFPANTSKWATISILAGVNVRAFGAYALSVWVVIASIGVNIVPFCTGVFSKLETSRLFQFIKSLASFDLSYWSSIEDIKQCLSVSVADIVSISCLMNVKSDQSLLFFPENIIITEPMTSFSQITRSINVIDIQNLVRYKVICNFVSHCMVVKIMRCH